MVSAEASSSRDADVAIIGDGLIGLSTALELGRAGADCVVFGADEPGRATRASAGLLIPSLGSLGPDVRPFFDDSLSRYPAFIEALRDHDKDLHIIQGVIERTADGDTLHGRDGAVDNGRLLAAVRSAALATGRVRIVDRAVSAIDRYAARELVTVRAAGADDLRAARVVLAAGAWSAAIRGFPRSVPVRPLKGQMIALGAAPLDRAIMGDDCYLVPRGRETLVGATVEEAGFDLAVTDAAVSGLRDAAVNLCPELRGAPIARSWAGTRPATPDMLPIIGADPVDSRVLYATGHSKNGILLAPATAIALRLLCESAKPALPWSLGPFSIGRFQ